MAERLGVRARCAVVAMRAVNGASRASGLGAGTVVGGRVALRVSPSLLGRLAQRRTIGLVSGTNGKTTTTACLAAALRTLGEVATNETGSNMPPGHVAALAASSAAPLAALECDEVWLDTVVALESPSAVLLLNLSRDQLDRTAEVRRTAERWRESMGTYRGRCVANADDPLVVHAALGAPDVSWFAGGMAWKDDAVACPRCMSALTFDDDGDWRCTCGFARPEPDATLSSSGVVIDGTGIDMSMALPGGFNRSNALGALLAAVRLGADPPGAAHAIASVREVAGRFSTLFIGRVAARLLLAKNPAGWRALLDLVGGARSGVVVAVNARVADGRDPSWLYDVDFERLAGRRVVASGERWRDVSTRLFYAGVDHVCEADPRRAAVLAGGGGDGTVELIANYTAFADLHAGR